jgi:hypothetical protein
MLVLLTSANNQIADCGNSFAGAAVADQNRPALLAIVVAVELPPRTIIQLNRLGHRVVARVDN